MSTLDILRDGRARIQRGWTQLAYARDASGEDLGMPGMISPDAVAWCAVGAIDEDYHALRFLKLAAGLSGDLNASLSPWNDAPDRTKHEVLALFDKAIAMAEAQ